MIERFGPYLELATIAETLGTAERIGYASDQFIQDLAVWYHLAWLGETVRRADPLVGRLTERGRDFTAAQRRDLLRLIGELVAQVVPRYRALAERGQVELSVTPYAHPIIPLLLDFHCARDAVPQHGAAGAPGLPGRASARGLAHRGGGARVHARLRQRPAGAGRPKGRSARGTLELLAARGGFRWSRERCRGAARQPACSPTCAPRTDPLAYNRPYRLRGTGMDCFFRDDTLSDLIGFTYATWHGDDAAAQPGGRARRSSRSATRRPATTPC